jgi:polysaccharide export outer membrane protein
MRFDDRAQRGWVLAGLLLSASGCAAKTGPFVWVDQYVDPNAAGVAASHDGYVIGVGDVISVYVWEQDKLSTKIRVRTDGRISMPIINDVDVAGKTPTDVARDLETRLKGYVLHPKVNVVVEESKPLGVSVIGEVGKPGLYTLDPGSGVAQALASAGGPTAFAHRNKIFVVRRQPKPMRIRFEYGDIFNAQGAASAFRLMSGDVVEVE